MNHFKSLDDSESWALLADAATRALGEAGYKLSRLPGRGRSNVHEAKKGGKIALISIRTTRNRSFAFPPLEKGTKWKTLSDVDLVAVASVDDRDNPDKVEVYLFPAADVRKRFDSAYKARTKAELKVKDNFGMWLRLDKRNRNTPRSVGSGLGNEYPPIATYGIKELLRKPGPQDGGGSHRQRRMENTHEAEPSNISSVIEEARLQISKLAGVSVDVVKLDLKIEY